MMKSIKKLIKITVITLAVYQFASWIFMAIIYQDGKEHPIAEIDSFIVDDFKNIIIADGFYSIIQVFDKNG